MPACRHKESHAAGDDQAAGEPLDPHKFIRIHRSVIVNVEHIQEIIREGQTEGSVVLTNGQRLKMSKAGWQKLLAVSRV